MYLTYVSVSFMNFWLKRTPLTANGWMLETDGFQLSGSAQLRWYLGNGDILINK
jgi:hypothetical protein